MHLEDLRTIAFYFGSVRPAARRSRERVLALQRRRLERLVAFAKRRSPLYRRLLARIDPRRFELADLPVVTKARLMESFDEWATDARLRLADLEEFLRDLSGDARFLGRWRVMTTSGSSGRRGVFAYAPGEWAFARALLLRAAEGISRGIRQRTGRSGLLLRVAMIATDNPVHVSTQFAFGAPRRMRILRLPARLPIEELVSRLESFRPEVLGGYPSVLKRLAREAVEGRARLAPLAVVTGGETLSPASRALLRKAFGVDPHDQYGATEIGVVASECERHAGLHVFEDACILEALDREGRPVADGERGARLLATSLFRRTQPVIRYEIGDVVTFDPEPCPCGSPLRRIRAVEGRAEEYLRLPKEGGGEVEVHPFALEDALDRAPGLLEYRAGYDDGRVRIRFVARQGVDAGAAAAAVARATEAVLRRLGVAGTRVVCESVASVGRAREKMDKASPVERP